MAEARVTQLGFLAEVEATPSARVSQFGMAVEVEGAAGVQVSQFGMLVEYEEIGRKPEMLTPLRRHGRFRPLLL